MLLDAIEKLTARERLQRITDISLGFGALKKETSHSILYRLRRTAEIGAREIAQPADAASLADAGIVVKHG